MKRLITSIMKRLITTITKRLIPTILLARGNISTRKYANNSGEQSYCGDPKAIIGSRTYANNAENNIVINRPLWGAIDHYAIITTRPLGK